MKLHAKEGKEMTTPRDIDDLKTQLEQGGAQPKSEIPRGLDLTMSPTQEQRKVAADNQLIRALPPTDLRIHTQLAH